MNGPEKHLKRLDTLSDLRERERDRLEADLASRRVTQQRFQTNLARLEQLAQGGTSANSSAGGNLPLALSLNNANYKQAVLQLADRHRQDLALHEAQMAQAQQALQGAALDHLVMGKVRERQQALVGRLQAGRDQKTQDEMANQAWLRRLAASQ
ncbi:MAG TPA: flagellar export protein FliJ [Ideonella sp.]|uniref:flagellar export protein FliJ n=1 Tax=Ideonella sp. TaxID=1929293 RepID=UPI002CFBB73E|nr:flagellar export protein FliJ [Ideonella sp.]HSI50170.1 flagellar export protein FliJ [Ideonella sp.]